MKTPTPSRTRVRQLLAAATVAASLVGLGATSAAAQPYPPVEPTNEPTAPGTDVIGRTDAEAELECRVVGDGTVNCGATGYAAGTEVVFEVAVPASVAGNSLAPMALPQDYLVIATGTREANRSDTAQVEFPYPCSLVQWPIAVRASGTGLDGSPAVAEDQVSTTDGVCVLGATLDSIRQALSGEVPLARTGRDLLVLAAVGLAAFGTGSMIVRRRRASAPATVA